MTGLFFLFTTVITKTTMNAYYSAAFRADPAQSLDFFYNFLDAIFFNIVQIFDHTYQIIFPVAGVGLPESFARKKLNLNTPSLSGEYMNGIVHFFVHFPFVDKHPSHMSRSWT